MCYLDTNIKTGDNTPFRISIYDKREDFAFRIVNFPHMNSNIPANTAYGVYISQLVRYDRICTSKVDFINRLRGLSLSIHYVSYSMALKPIYFRNHGLIVEKYGCSPAGDEISNPGLNCTIVSLHYIIYCLVLYFSCIWVRVRVQFYFERAHYLFIYLSDVYI